MHSSLYLSHAQQLQANGTIPLRLGTRLTSLPPQSKRVAGRARHQPSDPRRAQCASNFSSGRFFAFFINFITSTELDADAGDFCAVRATMTEVPQIAAMTRAVVITMSVRRILVSPV